MIKETTMMNTAVTAIHKNRFTEKSVNRAQIMPAINAVRIR
jgi:hypothetical protein